MGISRFIGVAVCLLACASQARTDGKDTLPSDIPPAYQTSTLEIDYVRREEMIPMRDGVKLYTLILMKSGTAQAPILLERTPYGADGSAVHGSSQRLAHLVSIADAAYIEDGYIRVYQDVRGRNRSEGVYVTNRPLSGPLNSTGIDHATDAYDTIDWLISHVPETNGRVGIIGGSYDGFTALMATLSGHPALRAAVPINPMVDVWKGDDWFHNGAFRQITLGVLPLILAGKSRGDPVPTGAVDLYALFLETGSAGDYIRRFGLDAFPAAQRFVSHAAYDDWWQGQALDRLAAAHPIKVPMLLVASVWDEQDLYGAPAVFRALAPLDRDHKVSLLMGPWRHMGVNGNGTSLGAIPFDEDTSLAARRDVIKPFLDAHLKNDARPFDLPPITSFATGGGGWRRSNAFAEASVPLYLHAKSRLSFERPARNEGATDQFVSDPARPVPVISRPFYFGGGSDSWPTSLVADQRFAGQRTDVLTYATNRLSKSVHIFGWPKMDLVAATSGTDTDFVVKLIDVYPDEMPDQTLSGYQLPVSMDIFRGRYLQSLEKPSPLVPGRPYDYRFDLPITDHIFAAGHRIMIQVQSSWFPVYDRNPQVYVPNIFNAKPSDYRKATQTVFHTDERASALSLPILGD